MKTSRPAETGNDFMDWTTSDFDGLVRLNGRAHSCSRDLNLPLSLAFKRMYTAHPWPFTAFPWPLPAFPRPFCDLSLPFFDLHLPFPWPSLDLSPPFTAFPCVVTASRSHMPSVDYPPHKWPESPWGCGHRAFLSIKNPPSSSHKNKMARITSDHGRIGHPLRNGPIHLGSRSHRPSSDKRPESPRACCGDDDDDDD